MGACLLLAGGLLGCSAETGGLQGPASRRMPGSQGPAAGKGGGGPQTAGGGIPHSAEQDRSPGDDSVCSDVPVTGNLEVDDGSGEEALARLKIEVEHGGIADPERRGWCPGDSVLNQGRLYVHVRPRQPLHLWLLTVDSSGRAEVVEATEAAVEDEQHRVFRVRGGKHVGMVLVVLSTAPLEQAAPGLARELREGHAAFEGRALLALSSGGVRAVGDDAGVVTVPLSYEHVFVGNVSAGRVSAGPVLVEE